MNLIKIFLSFTVILVNYNIDNEYTNAVNAFFDSSKPRGRPGFGTNRVQQPVNNNNNSNNGTNNGKKYNRKMKTTTTTKKPRNYQVINVKISDFDLMETNRINKTYSLLNKLKMADYYRPPPPTAGGIDPSYPIGEGIGPSGVGTGPSGGGNYPSGGGNNPYGIGPSGGATGPTGGSPGFGTGPSGKDPDEPYIPQVPEFNQQPPKNIPPNFYLPVNPNYPNQQQPEDPPQKETTTEPYGPPPLPEAPLPPKYPKYLPVIPTPPVQTTPKPDYNPDYDDGYYYPRPSPNKPKFEFGQKLVPPKRVQGSGLSANDQYNQYEPPNQFYPYNLIPPLPPHDPTHPPDGFNILLPSSILTPPPPIGREYEYRIQPTAFDREFNNGPISHFHHYQLQNNDEIVSHYENNIFSSYKYPPIFHHRHSKPIFYPQTSELESNKKRQSKEQAAITTTIESPKSKSQTKRRNNSESEPNPQQQQQHQQKHQQQQQQHHHTIPTKLHNKASATSKTNNSSSKLINTRDEELIERSPNKYNNFLINVLPELFQNQKSSISRSDSSKNLLSNFWNLFNFRNRTEKKS